MCLGIILKHVFGLLLLPVMFQESRVFHSLPRYNHLWKCGVFVSGCPIGVQDRCFSVWKHLSALLAACGVATPGAARALGPSSVLVPSSKARSP